MSILNKLLLFSVRGYIKLGLFFYFRRIHIHNINFVPNNKPVLFLANHQNALLDALLIAVNTRKFTYFLTRAGVFKSALVSRFLKSLKMLPVYRMRDGWSNLSNNTEIFKTCSKLFNDKEAIVIFPEGNHNLNRTVRPLSKGFTRIVFETLDNYPDSDLKLIPVGFNFLKAENFPDSVALFFGEQISAKEFLLENRNDSIINLKIRIQSEISKLTTHIPTDNYDKSLQKLNDLKVDFLNPISINNVIANNYEFYEDLKKKRFHFHYQFLKPLLIFLLVGPYVVWKFLIQPKIEEIEFISTFRFALAITLVPLWILILSLILAFTFDIITAISFIFIVLGVNLLVVKA